MAKLLLGNDRRTTAIKKLQEIVRKWPDTPAAKEARTLLQHLGQQVGEPVGQ